MILTIKKTDSLKGELSVPSSKSYSIRAFIVASRGGHSTIVNPSDGDDVRVAIGVAKALGVRIKRKTPRLYQVDALRNPLRIRKINVGESGTVLRFLLPLISLYEGKSLIVGEGTLQRRPNRYLIQTLRNMGVSIKGKGAEERVPIQKLEGRLRGGCVEIDGSLSSQFISAFLIACPSLPKDTLLKVTGKTVVSEPYITMTQQILKKAGVIIIPKNRFGFYIKGNQKYQGLKNFIVPADYGLAAFFLAAGTLVKSRLVLRGSFNDDLIQADGRILGFLRRMGVKFAQTKQGITIMGSFHLCGGNFSLKDCPDLVPIMAILALFAKGPTRLSDIGHVRMKESDRMGDLTQELIKIGAKVIPKPDSLVIHPQPNYKEGCLLDPHRDHRLAMSFCVLGLKVGVRVKDIECIRKSYPRFVRDLRGLGASLR